MSARPAASPSASDVSGFLLHEARLLDTGDFGAWLDLFDDDGVYWVPAAPGQSDPKNHVSIIYEDKPILSMRVQRLAHPRAYALEPRPRATRLVSNFWDEPTADAEIAAGCSFVMTEVRGDETRLFSGTATYRLRPDGTSYRIKSKRVDLLDCDRVHGLITLPF